MPKTADGGWVLDEDGQQPTPRKKPEEQDRLTNPAESGKAGRGGTTYVQPEVPQSRSEPRNV